MKISMNNEGKGIDVLFCCVKMYTAIRNGIIELPNVESVERAKQNGAAKPVIISSKDESYVATIYACPFCGVEVSSPDKEM